MSNQTTYAYDLSGNIVQKTLANGLTEVRSHDGRNRVSTLRNQNSAGTDIAGYAYQYDATGNVMEVVEDYPAGNLPGRTITNAYDGVYRLTSEEIATSGGSTVTTEYEYDKGHNRTSKAVSGGATTTYVIGDGTNGAGANQIVSATTGGVTTAYAYDANGNRSSRTVDAPLTGDTTNGSVMITGLASTTGLTGGMAVSGTGIPSGATVANIASPTSVTLSAAATATATGTTITFGNSDTYHYDDENRLVQLIDENGANPGTYTYGYDYRTRRVARTEPGPVTTNIVFDGGISIIEYGPAGAASPNVEYVRGHDYGGGVGGLEYSVRNGTASFNFYDSRGDVTTQTDASATVTFQTGYEAFGNQTTTRGATLDRQKASTKEQDPTGLLNEGFRYRDPETGTFLTRDPLGLKAGPNMYTYVRQNPWTKFDPEGLWSWSGFARGAAQATLYTVGAIVVGAVAVAVLPAAVVAVGGAALVVGGSVLVGKTIAEIHDRHEINLTLHGPERGRALSDEEVSERYGGLAVAVGGGAAAKIVPKIGAAASARTGTEPPPPPPPPSAPKPPGTGLGASDPPQRYPGPWTQGDLARAQQEGKGPVDMAPAVNKKGQPMPLELHHGDQMPGAAIHEVSPSEHKNPALHPYQGKGESGVDPKMRKIETQNHWHFRSQEMSNRPPPPPPKTTN